MRSTFQVVDSDGKVSGHSGQSVRRDGPLTLLTVTVVSVDQRSGGPDFAEGFFFYSCGLSAKNSITKHNLSTRSSFTTLPL